MPAPVETLTHGYGLVEGPRVDPDGNLYFSDVTKGGVFRRAPDGRVTTVVPKRKGVGGFNDLFADSAGRVLVGSLRSNPFELGREREPGECWRIDGAGEAVVLYEGLGLANEIGFSPDGRTLYHSDTAAGAVLAHDVAPDGSVANRRVFGQCEAPDGLAVDGGVWVASYGGGGVVRFDPTGRVERRVSVPAKLVSSCCFGGDDLRDLVVTSQDNLEETSRGGTIFRLRAGLPGLPPPLARV